jgi:hypothetical protein
MLESADLPPFTFVNAGKGLAVLAALYIPLCSMLQNSFENHPAVSDPKLVCTLSEIHCAPGSDLPPTPSIPVARGE